MIICDTGPLIAVLNADDKDHIPCRSALENEPGPLIVPAPVLTEVCYLASTRLGAHAEAAFLDSLAAGELQLEATTSSDLARMAELVRTYADFPLGAADASVVAIAERLGRRASPPSITGTSAPCARDTALPLSCSQDDATERPCHDRRAIRVRCATVTSGQPRATAATRTRR